MYDSQYGQFHRIQGMILLIFKALKVWTPIYCNSLTLLVKEKEPLDLLKVKYMLSGLRLISLPLQLPRICVDYHSSEMQIFTLPVFVAK